MLSELEQQRVHDEDVTCNRQQKRGGEWVEGSDMFSKATLRSAWLLAPVNTTLEDVKELE